ncbi:hypothetical protein DFH29DRAFT_953669 [Suillus ampliporus]|nr:hypothetical protein DFH29DRAFT_953669 [Suillus ampliporus]
MARQWVVRRHPLWAMFEKYLNHLPSQILSSSSGARQKEPDATKAADSTTGSADAIRAYYSHFGDECSSHWTGLISLQRQAAERARIHSENLQLLDNNSMPAKPNTGDQVAGNSSGIRLKPLTHRRPYGAGQFSRGVHTGAAPAPPTARTVNCNPKNANHPDNIGIEFPQTNRNCDISWNDDRTNIRDQLIRKVRHVIQYKYGPRYDVQPYGSSVYIAMQDPSRTGDGDLDLVVLDSKWPRGFSPEIDMKHLPLIYDTRKLARTMQRAGFTDVEAIPWARVPIVKFIDPVSGLHIDINVNERLGLLNTGLIKTYCDVVPSLRYLVSAIKKWARPRALNQPSASEGLRTFNSYALVLMTIAWLQTIGSAPKLQADLQPLEPSEHIFWMRPPNSLKRIPCDVRYCQPTTWVAPPMGALDNVVEQWFRFWAHFQFSSHVIDIKRGGVFPRIPHFEEAAEPDRVSRDSRSETRNNWSAFLGPDVDSTTMLERYSISVVDPFIRSKNVTKGINAEALHMFHVECKSTVELLKRGVDMVDIIDGFDLLKQDSNGYSTPAESPLKEVKTLELAHGEEVDVIPHWNLVLRQLPGSNNGLRPSRHSKPKRDSLSVGGRIPLSDTLESSHIANGSKQIRDDDEGFGLKKSYFEKNRRV